MAVVGGGMVGVDLTEDMHPLDRIVLQEAGAYIAAASWLAIGTGLLPNAGGDASPAAIAVDSTYLATSVDAIFGLGDCIAIHGAPCRAIGPIPRQANVVTHAVLGLDHDSYGHCDTAIRLKSKNALLTMSGPIRGEGKWRVTENDGDALAMKLWQDDTCIARLAGEPSRQCCSASH